MTTPRFTHIEGGDMDDTTDIIDTVKASCAARRAALDSLNAEIAATRARLEALEAAYAAEGGEAPKPKRTRKPRAEKKPNGRPALGRKPGLPEDAAA